METIDKKDLFFWSRIRLRFNKWRIWEFFSSRVMRIAETDDHYFGFYSNDEYFDWRKTNPDGRKDAYDEYKTWDFHD